MDFQPPSRPASASSTHRALDPVTFRIIENKDKDEIGKLYASARLRVPLDLLKLILKTTRERIEAKIDVGSNCTGFKMRQLFKRYDHDQKGLVALSEFRMMLEEFGIQMSEDQITVVFSVYDKHLCGEIRYLEFMQDMLDGDYFQFYKAGVNI